MPLRVLLVDDHKLVRDGIRYYLEGDDQYSIVAEAASGEAAVSLVEPGSIDVALVDINMTGMDGIACTQQLLKTDRNIKVLALTMLNESAPIRGMLDAGAKGYVLKSAGPEEIKKALQAVYQGGTFYSPEVTETVMNSLANRGKAGSQTSGVLSSRELEVLNLIVKEYSNHEIAEALFISPRTVDAHKRNLLEKTGSKNVAGLVMYAIQHKLV